jgi:hypothetical protein
VKLRDGRDEVVAARDAELEELKRDLRAHHVGAEVLRSGVAVAVPVEAGHRGGAAGRERPAENVAGAAAGRVAGHSGSSVVS